MRDEKKREEMVIFSHRANAEIERLRRVQTSEVEGVQTQLRYTQLRVQSMEQELKSVKLELDQKVREKRNAMENILFFLLFDF